ncbi:hypothetical protein ABIF43_000105 [Bradyrhizobium japonicum]
MLRARTRAGYEERKAQSHDAAGQSGQDIAERGEQRAEREQDLAVDPLGEAADRDLQPGHSAGIEPAHHRQ